MTDPGELMLAVYVAPPGRRREPERLSVGVEDARRVVHDHRADEPPLPMFDGCGCAKSRSAAMPAPLGPIDLD